MGVGRGLWGGGGLSGAEDSLTDNSTRNKEELNMKRVLHEAEHLVIPIAHSFSSSWHVVDTRQY